MSKTPTAREQRRARERAGTQIVFDPQTTFRAQLALSVPGGPLRGEYPRQTSQTLVAADEADLARGVFVALIDAYGFTRVARAVTGMFCELVNPVSAELRGMIVTGLWEGTGLGIYQRDVTVCVDCGAEQESYDIIDPNADDADDADALTTDDQTQHDAGCPTQTEDKTPEYKTEPAVMIQHPKKYKPLYPENEVDETTETAEIPDEALDKPLSLVPASA